MIVCVCHFVLGVKIVSTSESAPLFINLTDTVACPRSPRHPGWTGEQCQMCVPTLWLFWLREGNEQLNKK